MPFYDYQECECNRRGNWDDLRFKESRLVPVAERDAQTCDRCGEKLRRLTSSPGFKVVGGNSPSRVRTDV